LNIIRAPQPRNTPRCERQGKRISQHGLKMPPADLITLTRRNDGIFPIAAANETIDGQTLIAVHGNREMPICGFDVMVRSRI